MDKEYKQALINYQNIKEMPIKVKFNITTLDFILAFIYKDSTLKTRKTLNNMYKLFSNLDESMYTDSKDLQVRIWIIQKMLEAKLKKGFDGSSDMLIDYCLNDLDCGEYEKEVLESVPSKKISYEESKYIIKKLEDTLRFGYTIALKDIYKKIINSIEDDDIKSFQAISQDLDDLSTNVINIKRSISSIGSDQTFSLQDEIFDNVIEDSVQKLKDRNRIFLTGIRRWNTILSPGYMSKRLYLYLAFPGKGKSTILLKSALDIKRYNSGIKTKDPDKRPAVLFLTLENDIAETVERMYNMTTETDDIRNYTAKQVKKQMKEKGHLRLTESDNIDIIIKEYKNREIDTNDLYSIINDLSDEGVEVITLIVDYIKRIRPTERANDEKTELKNISNELKEIAKFYDIPVISAQQLNRQSASVIDAAMQADKKDVTRLVGRDGISGAWELLENSDWCCIINPENKADTEELYLTFKLLKRRYRSSEEKEELRRLEYFNHPFEVNSEIRLIDDVDYPSSISLQSLSTQFVPLEDKKGKTNAMDREVKEKKKGSKGTLDDFGSFEPFNVDNSSNF